MVSGAHVVVRDTGPRERWLRFARPRHVLCATACDEVHEVLRAAEAATGRGAWVAGFVAYEAAPAFDPALAVHDPRPGVPLAWFGIFDAPDEVSPPAGEDPAAGAYRLGAWTPSVDSAAYSRAIDAIRAHIAAGDTYQVNFTLRLRARFEGDPYALFAALCRAQPAPHAMFVDTGTLAVCSASPELFFERDGRALACRPMKGTARRGRTPAEDRALARALAVSVKDRAENVMIADMVRNDLGRIAATGSVEPRALCTVERYRTVWQMTSTINAVAADGSAGLVDVFRALFPSASITGAPKVRTSEIIRALECGPRGVYTGAMGVVAPGGRARFNVAIRTVEVDRAAGTATYGTGGGIVWDSRAPAEEREWRAKAALVLAPPPPRFDLLETLGWRPGRGWLFARAHLARLARSARYFDIPLDLRAADAALAAAVRGACGPRRVRLLVAQDGAVRTESAALDATRWPRRVVLASRPVDPDDAFLFHKTTHRRVYDDARREAPPEADDVLLWNTRGELTESTIANVVLRFGDDLVTPPLACGLLPGVYRADLLRRGRVVERPVPVDDLARADRVYLVNSVRGPLPVRVMKAHRG